MEIVKGDKTIHSEWEHFYKFLELLRQSGVCNMFGATPYLQEGYHLTYDESVMVLCNWMHNYKELNKMYGWR